MFCRDLNEVMQAVDYLKAHSLNTVEDLNAAIKDLSQTAAPLRKQLKQNENRMRAIAQIKDAAAIHAKLKPIHDTFLKKNFKLTKDAYAAQHKEELDAFNKAVRTLMKLNGGTTVDFSALDMLNQANGDRQILAKQLNISPHQLSYVTHSGEGEGLLFFGNVILPFVDHFPKDLELYRILTTRLSEVAEAQKHE